MNLHRFPLPLIVENLADGSDFQFETVSPFVFRWSGTDEQPARDIVVPRGFRTDFASIPRVFRVALDPANDVAPAALVHDFLYTCGQFEERALADRVFLDALRANGVGWIRARTMWAAVRLAGGSRYCLDPVAASDWSIRGAEAADQWERLQ